ncbi:nicotinamide riboside transporter PnuC [Neisseria sp. N95_16]|uniref:Nicotinamide riboside transporter PnuC n=1 Tax=Neisseria brasiliensis TaxID=2666100 RepID=A0A7X2GZE7_9NEIS|nr:MULTISPECIES: nicotinamide riboside transporter PnuC [Neisseria]MRN38780.1 nicotinamide riboside transporter PnuC [Neisseria brasiliensis]PJO10023.1 nicotinamide riboside transporter PnuC [Neisseria sp. N95_16]
MDIFHSLFAQYQGIAAELVALELVAVIFGMASVWLIRNGSVWGFPVGIVSTAGFVWLLWVYALFGDMLINAYYTVLSVYGWINWSKRQQADKTFRITPFVRKDWLACMALSLFSMLFVSLVYWFKPYINNGFSWQGVSAGFAHFTWLDYTDIFTTSLFLVAMWLMAEGKIAHWILWVIADAVSVPLYFYKGLTFSAFQYIVFTLIAISGYASWKKISAKQTHPSTVLP